MLPIKLQPRGVEKNVIFENPHVSKTVISIKDIYQWQDQYEKVTSSISWSPMNNKGKRRANTPEDTLYVLKGYLWFVHLIKFDCDFHMEIGSKDSSGDRIIVEVPWTNANVQTKIKHYLDSLGLPVLGCTETNFNMAHFKYGIPVLIKGYGFYDAYHKVNRSHGDHHTNKYLWELHPVTEIEFITE